MNINLKSKENRIGRQIINLPDTLMEKHFVYTLVYIWGLFYRYITTIHRNDHNKINQLDIFIFKCASLFPLVV